LLHRHGRPWLSAKLSQGHAISGIESAEQVESVKVFQAGTQLHGDTPVSSGGRVLGVTAMGADLQQARERAYLAVERIHFENSYYRKDIANKGLRRT
jgi:phosphoribosylamine---glycine ligase